MKITQVETVVLSASDRTNWSFIQIHTDEGLTGTGEATIGSETQLIAAVEELSTRLVGADPTRIAALTQPRYAAPGGRVHYAALSAVEHALWDITGQALGVPVYRLLGGATRDRIPLYANINRGTRDRAPEGFAARARAAIDQGFQAVKLAPFDNVTPGDFATADGRKRVARGIERVGAVRDAIGSDAALMVDCHWRFTLAEALEVARELEAFRPYWIEDMVVDAEPDEWVRFRSLRPERIAGGERKVSLAEFIPFIDQRAWDVVCPDVKYCGGMVELQRIAAFAATAALPIAPHNPSGPVGTLASAHACAAIDNLTFLEYQYEESPWRDELVNGAEQIVDGHLMLPTTPGLGCALDPAIVAAHPPISAASFAEQIGIPNP